MVVYLGVNEEDEETEVAVESGLDISGPLSLNDVDSCGLSI